MPGAHLLSIRKNSAWYYRMKRRINQIRNSGIEDRVRSPLPILGSQPGGVETLNPLDKFFPQESLRADQQDYDDDQEGQGIFKGHGDIPPGQALGDP